MSEFVQTTVSVSYMETLLDAFCEAGGSRADLLTQAGLKNFELQDPDNRLPVETITKIWVAAKKKTSNPLLGLQVGAHIRPGSFSVLGHLLMTAATLEEALDKAARFAVLVGDGGRLAVDIEVTRAIIHYDLVEKSIPCREERIEAVMASLVGFSRWITGHNIRPSRVCLTHQPLAEINAYEEVFLVTPEFGSPQNTIILERNDLNRPLIQSNPQLSALLGNHAEKVMTRVTQKPVFLLQLHQALKEKMREGSPDLETIAETLGLAPRSLQRKLAELETSFQDQLNHFKQEWAVEQLMNGKKSISEIAYSLGFSDPASFSRAFKRWTGKPPGKWIEDQHQ